MSSSVDSKGGGMEIEIHPLVVLSIADHSIRLKVNHKEAAAGGSGNKRAIGLLFGVQDGRSVKVYECVELAEEDIKDLLSVDGGESRSSIDSDIKLYTASYPSFECLGWYSTGNVPHAGDMHVHKRFQKYNEKPIYLLLDADVNEQARDLPINVYEESVHVVQDKTTSEFVRSNFIVSADEAERITMVHCAKVIDTSGSASDASSIPGHYGPLIKSVQSLQSRLSLLLQYLRDVQSGKCAADQTILRELKAIIQRLPIMDQTSFRESLISELNDAYLTSYLAAITRSSANLSDMTHRFQISQSSSGGHSRRDRGGGGGGGDEMSFMGMMGNKVMNFMGNL